MSTTEKCFIFAVDVNEGDKTTSIFYTKETEGDKPFTTLLESAITFIERGEKEFVCKGAKVLIVDRKDGKKHLTTKADGDKTNNLDSMPTKVDFDKSVTTVEEVK